MPKKPDLASSNSPSQQYLIVDTVRETHEIYLDHAYELGRKKISINTKKNYYSSNPNVSTRIALAQLERICNASSIEVRSCTMPFVSTPGTYTAWVPTSLYHAVRSPEAPYCPYFGDESEDISRAEDLYKDIFSPENLVSSFDLPSDGEVAENGDFRPPKYQDNSLSTRQQREAQRHTVLRILKRFGRDENVWNAIAEAFYLSIDRVKAIAKLAQRRKIETENNSRKIEEIEARKEAILKAFEYPSDYTPDKASASSRRSEKLVSFEDTLNSKSLWGHFCVTCHEFGCELHVGEKVIPNQPIPDRGTDERVSRVRIANVQPCSLKCCFDEEWRQIAKQNKELTPWTEEELDLLHEALMIVSQDPCRLAPIIGSRSCREVKEKIDERREKAWYKAASIAQFKDRQAAVRRQSASLISSAKTIVRIARQGGKQEMAQVRAQHSKGDFKKCRARKSKPQRSGNSKSASMEPRYVPCCHNGPCPGNIDCICFVNNMYCQTRCGCHNVRISGDSGSVIWEGDACGQTMQGCKCEKGDCLETEQCICAEHQVSCDVDICGCDCRILIDAHEQPHKCRNVEIIIPQHKKTFIGPSTYETYGMGLFAGEYFDKGDLVGVYTGHLIHVSMIEKWTVPSPRHTYAFDRTDADVLDSRIMGSKVRYVNHAGTVEEGLNCTSHFVRIRGEAKIALRTSRNVEPGEEFFFDYCLNRSDGKITPKAKYSELD